MKIWQFLELVKMKGRARAIQGGNKEADVQKVGMAFFNSVSDEDKHIFDDYENMDYDDMRKALMGLLEKYSGIAGKIADETGLEENFVRENLGDNYTIWCFLRQYMDE